MEVPDFFKVRRGPCLGESSLLSNGFKFSSELFNPCSAAILSNLLILTYPLRRKLQNKIFVSRQRRLVDMEFFGASDLNHLANNILELAPKVLYHLTF